MLNRTFARAIVGCLCFSGEPRDHAKRLASFTRGDWESAEEWFDHSGLALWFWDRMKRLGAQHAVPPDTAERFEWFLAVHAVRVAEMADEFESINRAFECAGIEYAVLKGFALIPDYVPDVRLRTTYDYDYLVSPDSLERADRPLQEEGYRHRYDEAAGHSHRYTRSAGTPRPFPRDYLYSPNLPRAVEMHSSLWELEPLKISVPLPGDFLARKRLRNWQGLSFYSLGEEDELIFQVLHAFRHILRNWCRLAIFFELAHFLERRGSDCDLWQRFYDRIRSIPPLPEMVGVVFSLAARLFGVTVPAVIDAKIMQTLPHPLLLWVARYGHDSALANFAENKYDLFLHREFVRDDAPWREVRRSRLLPIQRPNVGARAASPKLAARLTANWRQAFYVARRLAYHSLGGLRYLWESRRWQRLRKNP